MRIANNMERCDGLNFLLGLDRDWKRVEDERAAGLSEVECVYAQVYLRFKMTALGKNGLYSAYDA